MITFYEGQTLCLRSEEHYNANSTPDALFKGGFLRAPIIVTSGVMSFDEAVTTCSQCGSNLIELR